MQVYWLEQAAADVPANTGWLSLDEAAHFNALRFEKRRADWLLGRWTAKRALAAYLSSRADVTSLADLEIRPEPSGAPRALLAGDPAPATISLSHRDGRAICAVAPAGVQLGCDLEVVEPRGEAFADDYFTAGEQAALAQSPPQDRDATLTVLWSAKESVLKALQLGLRVDTREVTVDIAGSPRHTHDQTWHPLRAGRGADLFHGWWQDDGALVRTVVSAPATATPLVLKLAQTGGTAFPLY